MKKILVLTLIVICLLTGSALAKDLDEIINFGVSVQMREDGTADLTYHVDWRVLDDKTEGPLEWVKIGIPNQHVDSITALSQNIKKIGYLSDGGSYVKITFDRKYKANEVVTFEFSLHQSYLYVLEGDNVRYSLTAGWFDNIEVKNAVIRWKADGIISSNTELSKEGYLYWNTVLHKGERHRAEVVYPRSYFMQLNENQQATRVTAEDDDDSYMIVIGAIVVVAVIVLIVSASQNDNYRGGSGFGGGRTVVVHSHTHSGGCVRSSCACASCACACACACAGGGRAGCSKKDFYTGPKGNGLLHSDDVFPKLFQALENTKE
ncbi:MAG: hypothetical protein IK133_08610 [Clostridia bacterium]|nr:hypothetical protein [Clostridia bacterium]